MGKKRTRPRGAPADASLILQITGSKWVFQAAALAIRLRIADRLAKGPKTTADLAVASGASEDALYRLLRALASVGVFAETRNRRFRLTPAAQLFRTDTPGSTAGYLEFAGDESTWKPW